MNRREVLKAGCGAAVAAASLGLGRVDGPLAQAVDAAARTARPVRPSLLRHRFGIGYAPSKTWFYIWNDFDAGAVARDLDAIASLGADHIRMFLIWPYFQPDRKWVSPAHWSGWTR